MVILFNMGVMFGQDKHPKNIIVIDPGHGGKDSGAIGIDGKQEQSVVLEIAKAILGYNVDFFGDRYEIYLTRYSDTLISLRDRGRLARGLHADLFVSLHCNHAGNPNARGIEVYVSDRNTEYSKGATLLAHQVQESLKKQLGFEGRGVKYGNFQVLRETSPYSPSVLLELGFISNVDEGHYLIAPRNTSAIALVILMESIGYLNMRK